MLKAFTEFEDHQKHQVREIMFTFFLQFIICSNLHEMQHWDQIKQMRKLTYIPRKCCHEKGKSYQKMNEACLSL